MKHVPNGLPGRAALALCALALTAACGEAGEAPAVAATSAATPVPRTAAPTTPPPPDFGLAVAALYKEAKEGVDDYGSQAQLFRAFAASVERLDPVDEALTQQRIVQAAEKVADLGEEADEIPVFCLDDEGCSGIDRLSLGSQASRQEEPIAELIESVCPTARPSC